MMDSSGMGEAASLTAMREQAYDLGAVRDRVRDLERKVQGVAADVVTAASSSVELGTWFAWITGAAVGDYWMPRQGQVTSNTGNYTPTTAPMKIKRTSLVREGLTGTFHCDVDVFTNATLIGTTTFLVGIYEEVATAGGASILSTGAGGVTRGVTNASAANTISTKFPNLLSFSGTLNSTNFPNDDAMYIPFIRTGVATMGVSSAAGLLARFYVTYA